MKDLIPIIELVRLEESFRWGTFGVLKFNKEVFCVTLEPPDVLNKPNMSSIPAQQYMCWRIVSPTYGETFEVKDVPGRDHVLFHAGNTRKNTKGCIIIAEHFGKLGRNRAVLNSGNTFTKLMNKMHNYKAFHLTIKEVY